MAYTTRGYLLALVLAVVLFVAVYFWWGHSLLDAVIAFAVVLVAGSAWTYYKYRT